MTELPSIAGLHAVIWEQSDDPSGYCWRVRMASDGADRWSLAIEQGEDFGGGMEWSPDSMITPRQLNEVMHAIATPLGRASTGQRVDCDPAGLIPRHGGIVIGSGPDWTATLRAEGSSCDGHPLMSLTTSRPLTADEWIAVWRSIASALDRYNNDDGF